MPQIDIWITLENHAWDACPSGRDRMSFKGKPSMPTTAKVLVSPVTGVTRTVNMRKPIDNALILRRYTPNWAAPADQKVNPWDMNEPNPTDQGTMGTIPGPVIECTINDLVRVHFKNLDSRPGKSQKARTHSLHPHGFTFATFSDGAYPLTPPDPSQPIPASEQPLWAAIGVTGNKQGDRVPPGCTFTYTWDAHSWPTTAGVWLYHDHSLCDMENVSLGAIGIIVIHNPSDTADVTVTTADLPGGSLVGSPVDLHCILLPTPIPLLPHDLANVKLLGADQVLTDGSAPMAGGMAAMKAMPATGQKKGKASAKPIAQTAGILLKAEHILDQGDVVFKVDVENMLLKNICTRTFKTPPVQAQYLTLFHELNGISGMCMNGRTFLGNTPTYVAGSNTKMRFGVVGMGKEAFHTFHLHGHRWLIPGPTSNFAGQPPNPTVMQFGGPLNSPVSQFEDTKIFGPANSFVFTIDEGNSFMRADPPFGEWHLHCHVLDHMMGGMMGSLLVVHGGDNAGALPEGEVPDDCGSDSAPPPPLTVNIQNFAFNPQNIMVSAGQTVHWANLDAAPHTVSANLATGQTFNNVLPLSTENFDSANQLNVGAKTFDHVFNTPGTYGYHCEVHGPPMVGTVTVM